MTRIAGAVKRPVPGYVLGLIQDASPGSLRAGNIVEGANFVPTRAGQLHVRGGSRVMLTLKNDAGTPAEISHALNIRPFSPVGGLIIGWDNAQNKHYAWRVTEDMAFSTGTESTSRTDLTAAPSSAWNNGATPGMPVMAELWEKMFLCDANTDYATRNTLLSIDGSGTVLQPSFAFGSGAAQAIRPYVLEEYNGVLFVAGYDNEDGSSEDEPAMLRHSFLGRSPDDTTAGAEGFDPDAWNLIGAKGQRITALRKGKGLLLVAKEDELYRVSGFGRAYKGWQYQVDPVGNTLGLGIANPHALEFAEGYWYGIGAQGPLRTDGFSVESLTGPRSRGWRGMDLTSVSWVRYHPERRLMLFGLHPSEARTGRSTTFPWMIWVWDIDREVWMPDWDPNTDFHLGGALASSSADGPSAAPSNPAASLETTTGYTAGWTNGDATAVTELWERDSTAGAAFAAVTTSIAAGTATLARTGLSSGHTYEFKVRHRKNGIWSAFSSTVTVNTVLAAPSLGLG